MTTTVNSLANDRKRPSLSDQINRLDQTLDGLADGLNEAVADAVKAAVGGAVREAVQSVLTEVLTNPDLSAKLHAALAPAGHETIAIPAQNSVAPFPRRQRLQKILGQACTAIARLRAACGRYLRQGQSSIRKGWQATLKSLAALTPHWEMVRRFKYQIFTALGIGVLVGVGVWLAGPELGVAVSSLGAFVTSMTVQVGLWLRRMFAQTAAPLA